MQDFSMSVLTFQRKQRTLGDIHFCFLSQLAYNSEILSKFAMTIIFRFPQNRPIKAVWGIFYYFMQI